MNHRTRRRGTIAASALIIGGLTVAAVGAPALAAPATDTTATDGRRDRGRAADPSGGAPGHRGCQRRQPCGGYPRLRGIARVREVDAGSRRLPDDRSAVLVRARRLRRIDAHPDRAGRRVLRLRGRLLPDGLHRQRRRRGRRAGGGRESRGRPGVDERVRARGLRELRRGIDRPHPARDVRLQRQGGQRRRRRSGRRHHLQPGQRRARRRPVRRLRRHAQLVDLDADAGSGRQHLVRGRRGARRHERSRGRDERGDQLHDDRHVEPARRHPDGTHRSHGDRRALTSTPSPKAPASTTTARARRRSSRRRCRSTRSASRPRTASGSRSGAARRTGSRARTTTCRS